jgi:hypothetical protein
MISKLYFALFSTFQVTTVPSPPVINVTPPQAIAPAKNLMIHYTAESAKCSDGTLDLSAFMDSSVALDVIRQNTLLQEVEIAFRIDETGRALGIARSSTDQYSASIADIAPVVAAARFNPGKARFGCTVKYVSRASEIPEASLKAAFEYLIFPNMGRQQAVFDRVKPENSTCFNGAPAVLTRSYPDFSKVPATPGRNDWSMTQFDINASGKPVNVRTVGGTGNNDLDRASRDAVARSKFAKEATKGCLYPYWRVAGTVAAPASPEDDAFRPEHANCPKEIEWATQNPATYPDRFRKRYIEGWAVIVFDVAPWGSTGNVRIAAAEPAAEFGIAAKQVVEVRKVKNAGQGYTGCVERVRFRMSKPKTEEAGEETKPF